MTVFQVHHEVFRSMGTRLGLRDSLGVFQGKMDGIFFTFQTQFALICRASIVLFTDSIRNILLVCANSQRFHERISNTQTQEESFHYRNTRLFWTNPSPKVTQNRIKHSRSNTRFEKYNDSNQTALVLEISNHTQMFRVRLSEITKIVKRENFETSAVDFSNADRKKRQIYGVSKSSPRIATAKTLLNSSGHNTRYSTLAMHKEPAWFDKYSLTFFQTNRIFPKMSHQFETSK